MNTEETKASIAVGFSVCLFLGVFLAFVSQLRSTSAELTRVAAIRQAEESIKYKVHVSYEGKWSGVVGAGGNSRTEEGTYSRELEVEGYPAVAVVQKQDDNTDCMEVTVTLISGGANNQTSQQTCAAYGGVTVTGPAAE